MLEGACSINNELAKTNSIESKALADLEDNMQQEVQPINHAIGHPTQIQVQIQTLDKKLSNFGTKKYQLEPKIHKVQCHQDQKHTQKT